MKLKLKNYDRWPSTVHLVLLNGTVRACMDQDEADRLTKHWRFFKVRKVKLGRRRK